MPLKTREGVAEAPIEPGLRMLCDPCVFGPAMEVVPLDRPGEALAVGDPAHLDLLARLEGLDGHVLADDEPALTAELEEPAVRAVDVVLLQVPERAFVTFRSGTASSDLDAS